MELIKQVASTIRFNQVPYDENGNADDLRGHWRIQIGADNDVDSQHEFSIMNATDVGLGIRITTC
ncbi:TPA: hypothetical protein EYN98_02230 [Candidatus Poribacteria bacterium]|jgi:hypothetical protein|nr:hypothetical protein [Candidatus Poribacteria bacterium]HIN27772.1 hypothetical protein [Candidatus Poribacteria bacterium]